MGNDELNKDNEPRGEGSDSSAVVMPDPVIIANIKISTLEEDVKQAHHLIYFLLKSCGGSINIPAQVLREVEPLEKWIRREAHPNGSTTFSINEA